ncbi:MAG: AEC family transporter [Gammaproteobacteria bacterium]
MVEIFIAVAPVFALICTGWALARWLRALDTFWAGAEYITYHLFFPALLFHNALRVDLDAAATGSAVAVSVLAVSVMAAGVALLVRVRPAWPRSVAGAVLQGSIRPNTYIALGLADAVLGTAGVSLMALCVAAVVPTVNIISVVGLSHLGTGRVGATSILKAVATNPLILASGAGVLINALDVSLPRTGLDFVATVAAPALVLGLMTVGAALARPGDPAHRPDVALSSLLKLAGVPGVALAFAWALGLDDLALAVVVLYAAMPASPSSYVLAVKMKSDVRLTATLITTQTVISFVSLTLLTALLR